MKRAKSGRKPKQGDAAYQDFLKSIRELVEYLGALREKVVVEYEPRVNGIINSRSKDPVEIKRTLDGLLDSCGNPVILKLYKKLCGYYYGLDPLAATQYVLFYWERWDPETLKKVKKRYKK